MNCEVIKEIIPAYIDHSASEEENKIVEEHLCVCNDCRQYSSQCIDALKPVIPAPAVQEVPKPIVKTANSIDMFNLCIIGAAVSVLIFFIFLLIKK